MNLRPALRAFVESSHPSFQSPVALVTRSSAWLTQSSHLRNSDPHSFGPRSSSFLGSSHHSQFSFFRSSTFDISSKNEDPEAQSVSALAKDSEAVEETVKEDVLVQYIVIRKDLASEQNWPLGSIISQGCHAAVAAIWLSKDDPETALYCRPENLDHMHKVTLEVKGETQLRNLAQKLETAGIVHKLWIEQPENYATCLATKPYYKSQVAAHFKKLKLCK